MMIATRVTLMTLWPACKKSGSVSGCRTRTGAGVYEYAADLRASALQWAFNKKEAQARLEAIQRIVEAVQSQIDPGGRAELTGLWWRVRVNEAVDQFTIRQASLERNPEACWNAVMNLRRRDRWRCDHRHHALTLFRRARLPPQSSRNRGQSPFQQNVGRFTMTLLRAGLLTVLFRNNSARYEAASWGASGHAIIAEIASEDCIRRPFENKRELVGGDVSLHPSRAGPMSWRSCGRTRQTGTSSTFPMTP